MVVDASFVDVSYCTPVSLIEAKIMFLYVNTISALHTAALHNYFPIILASLEAQCGFCNTEDGL